jgi:arylsulfatase A-like enzyme
MHCLARSGCRFRGVFLRGLLRALPARGRPLLVAVLLLSWPYAALNADPAGRPNIVLIMADDMGYSDLGCYGSEIETPHLDTLAENGVRFTQFYNTARCCPTRASLLTGLYSHQAGVGHMVDDRGLPGYRGHLNDRCVTIAEVLRPAGYKTWLSGKWHVGEQRPHWPVDRGFERSYALVSGGTNYFRLDPGRTLAMDDQRIEPPADWYVTDAISDHAVKFIHQHGKAEDPFFLYVAYTAPHWPLHAHEQDIAKYRGKYQVGWDTIRQRRLARMKDHGVIAQDAILTPRDAGVPHWDDAENKDDWDLRMAVYAAQIDSMDPGIGQIVAEIKEQGKFDNTLILFLADNGGCAEIIDRGTPGVPAGKADSFLSYGVGWANASNTPFRRYKHWVHEGGISSPLVAHWPKGIKSSGITHEIGHVVDLMATCLDVAKVRYPGRFEDRDITPLEGKSLRPILEGGPRDRGVVYWEHEGNRAVRRGKWKLVAIHNGPWELYDMEADRTEIHNLAAEHPDVVQELKAAWEQWASQSNVEPWGRVQQAARAKAKGKAKTKAKTKAGKGPPQPVP